MLIKLRIIGLVFIMLFSTSTSFGQNYESMSLNELTEDLNYWHNVLDKNDWWFFKKRDKFGRVLERAAPVFLHKDKGFRIAWGAKYGYKFFFHNESGLSIDAVKISKYYNRPLYEIDNELNLMYVTMEDYSNKLKEWHRDNTIPTIENAIRSHLVNQSNNGFNPIQPVPTGANLCPRTGTPSAIVWIRGNSQLGTRCHYHLNGELHEEISYQNKKWHGTKAKFWDNGKEREVHTYKNGKRHGPDQYSWYKNGNPMNISDYTDGRKNGKVETFSKNGNPSTCRMYSHGKKTHNCSQ